MRILFVIDGLPGGGAEKVVLTLAEGMTSLGHRVSLFSLRDVCDYPIPKGVDYQILPDNTRVFWRKITEIQRRAKQLDREIVRAQQDGGAFDLVISNLHKTDRIVSQCRSLQWSKVWFSIHGIFSASYLGNKQGFSRWLKRQKIAHVYQNKNIVGVSQAAVDDLIQHFNISARKTTQISNPFDIEAILKLAAEPCELPFSDYLIHVGRLHPNKRHDRLLKAYAKTGLNYPLVLVGKGSEAYTEKLKSLAEELGIAEKVKFIGFCSNPYPYIKHAKTLILSSDSEGFGNVLVEALICGTPVVSTNCPGGPSTILTGNLAIGLADMNEDSLAEKIVLVTNNPPIIEEKPLLDYGIIPTSQKYLALANN
ncbi:GDP-mannose-dependent alpha-(1-6)-phosphatidylinositol monomannoside mannosyltransferase [Pragia fontium]|uniref:glycosyltransferase n=1 Tax=Pragia fontium TaxID=82985 RepID=UPI000E02DF45|nr:glycosyltransferase [Pragia fontium]SUB84039.1 GDP-mannose-dependent alpha-(1-6)-phosphatidylinositol monomannoside mannosyltransferase [Pragia fontium]